MTLIPIEDLVRAYKDHIRSQPKIKADILCEAVRENPGLTVAELAAAVGWSPAWVRKNLKQAGIVLVKPLRQQVTACTAKLQVDNPFAPEAQKADRAAVDAPTPSERQGFVYRPRELAQWEARMKLRNTRQAGRK